MEISVKAVSELTFYQLHYNILDVRLRWLDPLYLIWLERFEQADLPVCRLCKVASEELHDGEGDDPDGDEDGEEDPVELVEEAQVWSSLSNKAPLSEADEENSVTRPNWEVLQGLLSNQFGRPS